MLRPRLFRVVAVLLLVGVAAAAGAVALRWKRSRAPDVLAVAPPGTWMLATLDLVSLRGSPVADALLEVVQGARDGELGRISASCGFDPLSRARSILLASPEAGSGPAVAIAGEFTRDELTACATRVIHERGGEPVTTPRGAFTVVEDRESPGVRLAYRDGLCLVGRGPWLDAMMAAAEGHDPGPPAAHRALRDSLAGPGAPGRALVLTALLPRGVRDRLRTEIGPEVPERSDASEAFAGALAVEQAALAIRTGAAGSSTEVSVELRCETPEACHEVEQVLLRKRLALSRDFRVRLVGAGPLLDSLAIDVKGTALSARATLPTDDLARLIRRLVGPPRPRPRPQPPEAPLAPPTPTDAAVPAP